MISLLPNFIIDFFLFLIFFKKIFNLRDPSSATPWDSGSEDGGRISPVTGIGIGDGDGARIGCGDPSCSIAIPNMLKHKGKENKLFWLSALLGYFFFFFFFFVIFC